MSEPISGVSVNVEEIGGEIKVTVTVDRSEIVRQELPLLLANLHATSTKKRGPGRPRKPAEPVTTAEAAPAAEDAVKATPAAEAPPVKRGPGRPRKVVAEVAAPVVEAPAKAEPEPEVEVEEPEVEEPEVEVEEPEVEEPEVEDEDEDPIDAFFEPDPPKSAARIAPKAPSTVGITAPAAKGRKKKA